MSDSVNSLESILQAAVQDVMTRDVVTVGPDVPVEQAVGLVVQHGIGGLPVVDRDENLRGIVTDYVLLRMLYEPEIRTKPLADIMTAEVVTVTEETTIAEAAHLLVEHHIHRIPVVDGKKVVGIVSRDDLIRYARRHQGRAALFQAATSEALPRIRRNAVSQVLVVDDSAVMHEMVRDALGSAGYELEFCFSGNDALDRIRDCAPDLILLDRLMPGIDGLGVLRELQSDPNTRSIPVIMITACDRPAHVAEAFSVGAVDYINKPFAAIDVQARVASALRMYDLQRELAEERVKAENARIAKSEFLANMSHEIRTPMTAILGFADVLADNITDPENVDAVETICRNGRYLLDIINDILDVSKIEAGKLQIEMIATAPKRVADDVLGLMRARAVEKGLSLEVNYATPIPETILTDPVRLRQILINLIGNAIKFTDSGRVEVTMGRHFAYDGRSQISIAVADSGIGLDQHQIKKLFQPFSQADSSTTRQFGGTGLGLTICKRLAGLLGGDVTVESKPGEGSTFTVTIDARVAENDAPLQAAQATPVEKQVAAGVPLDCRVLLAEDGLDNQRLISFVLKKAGAEVTCVENGALAIAAAQTAAQTGEPFDVVLMDMQMPVLGGLDATRQLRQAGYVGSIVALTANALKGVREECLQAGCDDYMTKPIDRARLISLVGTYVRQRAPVEV